MSAIKLGLNMASANPSPSIGMPASPRAATPKYPAASDLEQKPVHAADEDVRTPLRDALIDSHGRILRDLRISITDRCNFRCLYCLPETEEAADFYRAKFDALKNPSPPAPITRDWKPRSQILTFEEIERVVRLAVQSGISKVRVTGGEPLV